MNDQRKHFNNFANNKAIKYISAIITCTESQKYFFNKNKINNENFRQK